MGNSLGTLTLARTTIQGSKTHSLLFPCGNRITIPGFGFPSVNEHGDMGVLEPSTPCSSGGGGESMFSALSCMPVTGGLVHSGLWRCSCCLQGRVQKSLSQPEETRPLEPPAETPVCLLWVTPSTVLPPGFSCGFCLPWLLCPALFQPKQPF